MKVIYPGSFHPPTLGHIDVIRRAAALFEEVVVAVLANPDKTYSISPAERVQMLQDCLAGLENVRVVADRGLLAVLCQKEGADAILRSLRSGADFEYEAPLAEANAAIGAPPTLYLGAAPALAHISSTIARDIAGHDGPLEKFLPEQIIERVRQAFA